MYFYTVHLLEKGKHWSLKFYSSLCSISWQLTMLIYPTFGLKLEQFFSFLLWKVYLTPELKFIFIKLGLFYFYFFFG